MTFNRMRHLPALLICAAVAACGPSEGFQQVPWDMAIASNTQLERLQGFAPTTESNVPDTGSASYTGFAVMRLGSNSFPNAGTIGVVADATLDVDFSGAGSVTGRLDGFEAVNGADTDFQTSVPASGSIVIGQDESLVGTTTVNNGWGADYRGNINVDGTNYTVDNVLYGGFLGNRVSDPTPERITKGIFGTNVAQPTQYAVSDGGSTTPFEITVFGETPR